MTAPLLPKLNNLNIMKLGTGFFSSKVLLSAIELEIFTLLAKQPLPYQALTESLNLDKRAARVFFDALVALGMLNYNNDCYHNTPETDYFLDKQKPSYCGHWLEMANRRLFKYWYHLTDALKTGHPQNEYKDHSDPFKFIYANDEAINKFLDEMSDVSLPLINEIAELFPWQKFQTFIDIGGCKGVFSCYLATQHPHLQGGTFDLPQLKSASDLYVSTHKLTSKLKFYPGNFHQDPLPTAQVLVMGHVLVDWDLEIRKNLINKAFEALPSGGALLIYDMMIDDTRKTNIGAMMMSLNMLIETQGGSTYTTSECVAWLEVAGFCNIQTKELCLSHSLVIAYKP